MPFAFPIKNKSYKRKCKLTYADIEIFHELIEKL